MSPTEQDPIRELLESAVSDVEPAYGLDRIRSRTATRRSRTWMWVAGAAGVATAAAVAAVAAIGGLSVVTIDGGSESGPAAGGGSSSAGSSSAGASTAGPVRTVYFVGDTGSGPRLFGERHRTASPDHAVDEAVEAAVSGRASDPDYGSPWPSGTTMERAQLSDGVLSVDLSGPVLDRPAGLSRATATTAVQQLVWTAQAATGSRLPVTFLVAGRPTDRLLGESTARPVARASADDVLAPVQVTTPAQGSTVTSPVTVTGSASAFEGTVQWELRDGDTVVKRGYATTKECCTLSPYTFTVTAPAGDYTLVVHDEDVSDGEGNPMSGDTKALTVR
jgi:hypothetical protein